MVSGFKKSKKKQKMSIAKDQKQLILAIIVIAIFVLNGIYAGFRIYWQDHPIASKSSSVNSEQTADAGNDANALAKGNTTSPEETEAANATGNPEPQPAESEMPPGGNGNLVLPLLAILLVAILTGGGLFVAKKFGSKNKQVDAQAEYKKLEASSKSRSKGKNNNEAMPIAKDKKQLQLAIFMVILFILGGIYSGVRIYLEYHPMVTDVKDNSEQAMAGNEANALAPGEGSNNAVTPENQANTNDSANDIYVKTLAMNNNQQPQQEVSPESSNVDIMATSSQRKFTGKMITISVANSGRSDPFANPGTFGSKPKLPKYLTPPPDSLPSTPTDAGKVMTTTVSGILYDKYSPSAILNIEGADYLVKKGDIINNYRILYIGKTQVIVQLGRNIYKAGVGELLSPTDLNFNTIANLNRKFGGNSVSINVKKKQTKRK